MKLYNIKDPEGIILRDYLARDRTALAAENTFLSYVRTCIGLFGTGAGCVKFIQEIPVFYYLGFCLVTCAPVILIIGIIRHIRLRKLIRSIPDNSLLSTENEE